MPFKFSKKLINSRKYIIASRDSQRLDEHIVSIQDFSNFFDLIISKLKLERAQIHQLISI